MFCCRPRCDGRWPRCEIGKVESGRVSGTDQVVGDHLFAEGLGLRSRAALASVLEEMQGFLSHLDVLLGMLFVLHHQVAEFLELWVFALVALLTVTL